MTSKLNHLFYIFSLILLLSMSSNTRASSPLVPESNTRESAVRDHRTKPRAAVRDHRTSKNSDVIIRDHRNQAPASGRVKQPEAGNDVTAIAILADSCQCNLRDVNAIYMQGIKVLIGNNGSGKARQIKIKLSYFSLTNNSIVSTYKTIALLKSGETTTIQLLSGGHLVRKSSGLTVEVQAANDRNTRNNTVITKNCARRYIR